jgi:pyridoxine 5-phosphate synthase
MWPRSRRWDAGSACSDGVELYTGPYAEAFAAGDASQALQACVDSVRMALSAGLDVNAGHDLSQTNLGAFLDAVPRVQEVSIGHALIDEALYAGLDATVRAYVRVLEVAR